MTAVKFVYCVFSLSQPTCPSECRFGRLADKFLGDQREVKDKTGLGFIGFMGFRLGTGHTH